MWKSARACCSRTVSLVCVLPPTVCWCYYSICWQGSEVVVEVVLSTDHCLMERWVLGCIVQQMNDGSEVFLNKRGNFSVFSDTRICIWYNFFMKFSFWDLSKLMGSIFKGKLMKLPDGCVMYETRSSQPETLLFLLWRETVFTICFDSLFCCCMFLYCYCFFVILLQMTVWFCSWPKAGPVLFKEWIFAGE